LEKGGGGGGKQAQQKKNPTKKKTLCKEKKTLRTLESAKNDRSLVPTMKNKSRGQGKSQKKKNDSDKTFQKRGQKNK